MSKDEKEEYPKIDFDKLLDSHTLGEALEADRRKATVEGLSIEFDTPGALSQSLLKAVFKMGVADPRLMIPAALDFAMSLYVMALNRHMSDEEDQKSLDNFIEMITTAMRKDFAEKRGSVKDIMNQFDVYTKSKMN